MYKKIGNITLWQSEYLIERGVTHGFTLRTGGVSGGAYQSLNIGQRRGDDIADVERNIHLLADALSFDYNALTVTLQEHTDSVAFLNKEDIGRGLSKAWNGARDAIISPFAGVPVMCYCADCVPIILYSPFLVAVVHSGWRGTVANIAAKAVRMMTEAGAKDIYALIGPCIRKCCYEVSADVAELFDERFYDKKPNGKYMLDLAATVKNQLEGAGARVEDSKICTFCENDKFFSHRAQGGVSGNLGAVIVL